MVNETHGNTWKALDLETVISLQRSIWFYFSVLFLLAKNI